jgi:hypothetical protein
MQEINFFNVKWTFNNNNLQQSCHLKFVTTKNIYIREKKCILVINSSFDDFYKKNNIILTFFGVHFFHFFGVTNVVLSFEKFVESIIFFKFIQNFMMISIKGYDNMNN